MRFSTWFFVVAGGLLLGCGSGTQGEYGDTCTVYAVDKGCTGSNVCECIASGCYCTKACVADTDCPSGSQCTSGHDPSTTAVGSFCFSKSKL